MAEVKLNSVVKAYDGNVVVKDLDLFIEDGEFVVLVGPSGCGKTTTLRMIAGLEEITSGEIRIGSQVVNDVAPKDRDIAMVFQNYALYAHMTVRDNIAFGLKLRRVGKDERMKRVEKAAQTVGMQSYLDRKPKALSGGQRQRVALARAIVREPGVFLFDEPLSNLDAKLRVQMRMEIASLQRSLGTTTIYVTHDQVEAMTMASRIAVLNEGVLQQYGAPMDLYNNPKNVFVAGFIGSPSMNFIDGTINADRKVKTSLFDLNLPGAAAVTNPCDATLGFRPEKLRLESNLGTSPGIRFATSVKSVEQMGNESLLYLEHDNVELIARVPPQQGIAPGDVVNLSLDPADVYLFDQATGEVL